MKIQLLCLFLLAVVSVAHCGRRFRNAPLVKVKSTPSSSRRVVCYYGSWAVYRPDLGKFDVEDIDPFVCTHVIYAFAGLNPSTSEIEPLDPYNDVYDNYGKGAYNRFANLTFLNPDLKCMLGIGGWNEGSTKYSDMANNPTLRTKFVNSVAPFLKKYGFVGLDMDWEYPTQRGGRPEDKQAYVELLKELRESFDQNGHLLLSAAVSAGKDTIDAAYDVPNVIKYLDFINVMAYDYHGTWESITGINAPLFPQPNDTYNNKLFNVNYSANYWIELGAPASQLNLGMPTYGHSWTLSNPNNHGLNAPTNGPGQAGPYTRQGGTLGYNEVCVAIGKGGWATVVDPYYLAPYSYQTNGGNQWISWDDQESIKQKCLLANTLNLGGAMIWSIETDDFHNTCGAGVFPLLAVINEYIRGVDANTTRPPPPPPPTTTPYTGPSTSATTTTPAPPTTTTPAPPTPNPTDICKKSGFQADPNDCTTFYNCIPNADGTWSVFTFHCGSGTVFDPSIDACNYAANVPDCHADI